MINSLYGVWRGNNFHGLAPKTVLGKLILVNETRLRIVYSVPEDDDVLVVTDEIGANCGEAICFIHQYAPAQQARGPVVIGPEAEIASWIRYYFFEPHLIPSPKNNLKIEKSFLKVKNITVSRDVLRSYSPEVALGLQKILRKRYSEGTSERKVLESLLSAMGKGEVR